MATSHPNPRNCPTHGLPLDHVIYYVDDDNDPTGTWCCPVLDTRTGATDDVDPKVADEHMCGFVVEVTRKKKTLKSEILEDD